MALRAQLAPMGAASDPTAARATGALWAQPALLPHGRRRSATQASAEVLRPRSGVIRSNTGLDPFNIVGNTALIRNKL